MANGADSEQFVVLSGVRTGLKREFAFAMKAQSEICGSLGRTRASRNRNAGQVVDRLVQKRSRKSGSAEGGNSEPKGENLKGGVVKTEGDSGGGDDDDVGDVMSEEEAKSDVVDVEEPKNQVGESKSKALDDDDEPKGDVVVVEDEAKVVVGETGKVDCEGEVKEGEVCCSKEDGVVGGVTPVLVAGGDGGGGGGCSVKGVVVSVDKPMRRFTRSALKRKLDDDDDGGAKVGNYEGNGGAEAVEVGDDGKKEVNASGKDVEVFDDVKEEIEHGSLVTSPVQMKMSKATNTTRKRCPTNLKDLLATGILEGLPVNYVRGMKVLADFSYYCRSFFELENMSIAVGGASV